MNDMNDSR